MATTPLYLPAVTYPGQWPGRVRDAPAGLRKWWLGRPGNMIQLPAPQIGYKVTLDQGESATRSLGGVTTTVRRRSPSSTWELQWTRLAGRDRAIVLGFYSRSFGAGPWALLDPADANRLTAAVSRCGAASGALEGWVANTGAVTYDPTITPPIIGSGVMRWSGATSGGVLAPCAIASGTLVPDVTTAPPYLPSEPVTASVWAWVASGTRAASLYATGAGGSAAVSAGGAVTLTTTPQRFTATGTAGALGSNPYVLPALVAGDNGTADILISAPQIEVAAAATDWTFGTGVPRVVCTSPLEADYDSRHRADIPMTLAE